MSQASIESSEIDLRAVSAVKISWPVRLSLAAMVLATAFVRPGDTPYLLDEPNLMHTALLSNHQPSEHFGVHLPFTLCARNPTSGARQVHYGPAPLWLYQLILAITTDPILVMEIHALLLASLTALALVWLARSMNITPWLAVVMMFSPLLWLYHRRFWDISLCIPLSAMSIAAYADFLITRRASRLYVTAVFFAILPIVHLMSLALIVPIAGHFLIYGIRIFFKGRQGQNRRAGFLHLAGLLAIVAAINLLAWPYWESFLSPSSSKPYFVLLSRWKGWIYPLLGAQDLTAGRIDWGILGNEWYSTLPTPVARMAAIAQTVSLIGFVAVWGGTVLAAAAAWRVLRRSSVATVVDHAATIALGVFVCQCILDGTQRAYESPHYFNATWIAYVVFAWLAIGAMIRRFWARSILLRLALRMYAASLMIFLSTMIWKIAQDGGSDSLGYGTTLSEQVAAVRSIHRFSSAQTLMVAFEQWQTISGELISLNEMMPQPPGNYPLRRVLVRYRSAYPGDAHVVVEDFPPDAP